VTVMVSLALDRSNDACLEIPIAIRDFASGSSAA